MLLSRLRRRIPVVNKSTDKHRYLIEKKETNTKKTKDARILQLCLFIAMVVFAIISLSYTYNPTTTIQQQNIVLPHLINNVVVLDVLWAPSKTNDDGRIIITSYSARHYKEYPLPSKYNVTHESIQHPCNLNITVNNILCEQCEEVNTHTGDWLPDTLMNIASFSISFAVFDSSLKVKVYDQQMEETVTIANLDPQQGKLNALQSFDFYREYDLQKSSISVCIKMVRNYSPFILDMINVCNDMFANIFNKYEQCVLRTVYSITKIRIFRMFILVYNWITIIIYLINYQLHCQHTLKIILCRLEFIHHITAI